MRSSTAYSTNKRKAVVESDVASKQCFACWFGSGVYDSIGLLSRVGLVGEPDRKEMS